MLRLLITCFLFTKAKHLISRNIHIIYCFTEVDKKTFIRLCIDLFWDIIQNQIFLCRFLSDNSSAMLNAVTEESEVIV